MKVRFISSDKIVLARISAAQAEEEKKPVSRGHASPHYRIDSEGYLYYLFDTRKSADYFGINERNRYIRQKGISSITVCGHKTSTPFPGEVGPRERTEDGKYYMYIVPNHSKLKPSEAALVWKTVKKLGLHEQLSEMQLQKLNGGEAPVFTKKRKTHSDEVSPSTKKNNVSVITPPLETEPLAFDSLLLAAEIARQAAPGYGGYGVG